MYMLFEYVYIVCLGLLINVDLTELQLKGRRLEKVVQILKHRQMYALQIFRKDW